MSLVGETGFVEGGCGLGCWFEEELATGDFLSFTEGGTLTTGFCIGVVEGLFWEEIGREFGCFLAPVADGFRLGFTLLVLGGLTAVGFLGVTALGF